MTKDKMQRKKARMEPYSAQQSKILLQTNGSLQTGRRLPAKALPSSSIKECQIAQTALSIAVMNPARDSNPAPESVRMENRNFRIEGKDFADRSAFSIVQVPVIWDGSPTCVLF